MMDKLYKLASCFFEEGDCESAKIYFSLGTSYDHNNLLFWKGKAEGCKKPHNYKDVISAYDRAYEIYQETSVLIRREAGNLNERESLCQIIDKIDNSYQKLKKVKQHGF